MLARKNCLLLLLDLIFCQAEPGNAVNSISLRIPAHVDKLRAPAVVDACLSSLPSPPPPARGQAATEGSETGFSTSLQPSSPPEQLSDILGKRGCGSQ